MKRQNHAAHSTHQVTGWAPNRSESQPPAARMTPPGSEKHAASRAAWAIGKWYSLTKYCGIQTESAMKPPATTEQYWQYFQTLASRSTASCWRMGSGLSFFVGSGSDKTQNNAAVTSSAAA